MRITKEKINGQIIEGDKEFAIANLEDTGFLPRGTVAKLCKSAVVVRIETPEPMIFDALSESVGD